MYNKDFNIAPSQKMWMFWAQQCMEVLAVALFLLMGSVLFLIFPPVIFSYVEDWSYGEGFYYAFITLSTIGFGDYVVGEYQWISAPNFYICNCM